MAIFFTKKSCNMGGGTTPQMPLTVNSIWGGWYNPPPTCKKFVKKTGKCNQYYFLLVLPKSS